jgi:CRP/FNR family transcriptional regulator, cyclic AMP receptor protein
VVDDLLQSLSPSERSALLQVSSRRRYRRGEVVFHEGDPGDALHVVTRGLFVARASTYLGQVVTVNLFPAGSVFGELALISPDSRRSATVAAVERSESLVLRREPFEDLRRNDRGMDTFLVSVLARRNRDLTGHLTDLLFNPAEERVLRRLLLLDDVTPKEEAGGWVRATQEDVAAFAGTTRATVNRAMRQAERDGLIELARGRYRIVDRDRLRRRVPDRLR